MKGENGGLAYVFWHWKRPEVPVAEYEARQRAFHEALAAHPPAGFARSFRCGVSGLPWANEGGPAYEDWYLVRDSAALDSLDAGATSGARKSAHDGAASGAAGGTAGLYRPRLGGPIDEPRHALWLARPAGTSYDDWFALLEPVVEGSGGVLWMRRMVLGPLEFCLQSPVPVELPELVRGLTVALRPNGSAPS